MYTPARRHESDVPILVLSPRYTLDSRALRQAALQKGWHVERLGSWHAPERLFKRRLIFAGELSFMQVMAHKLSWTLLDATPDWLPLLPFHYRKRAIEISTLAEARRLTQASFVKPASGKTFEANVYTSGKDLPESGPKLTDKTDVLIAEPVRWEIEFRFFICERRVVTFSSYWRGDHPTLMKDGTWGATRDEQTEAQSFIHELLVDENVKIPPAIVIDVGKICDRGWAVIEANAAWAAGIYGCDPHQILPVLERACVRRDEITTDDALWTNDFENLEHL